MGERDNLHNARIIYPESYKPEKISPAEVLEEMRQENIKAVEATQEKNRLKNELKNCGVWPVVELPDEKRPN